MLGDSSGGHEDEDGELAGRPRMVRMSACATATAMLAVDANRAMDQLS